MSPKRKKTKRKKTTARARAAASVATDWDRFFTDFTVFSRCAVNDQEKETSRQQALNTWANEDIERIERIDTTDHCGWAMWRK